MKLRTKSFLFLAAGSVVLLATLHLAVSAVLQAGFRDLEIEFGRRELQRVRVAVQDLCDQLAGSVNAWAGGVDTQSSLQNGSLEFNESKSRGDQYSAMNLDLMVLLDNSGRVRGYNIFNAGGSRLEDSMPADFECAVNPLFKLAAEKDGGRAVSGLIRCHQTVWIVAARQVAGGDSAGNTGGVQLLARRFDRDVIQKLCKRENLVITDRGPDPGMAAFDDARTSGWLDPPTGDVLPGFIILTDIFSKPVTRLEATLDRAIHRTERASSVNLFYLLAIAGGVWLVFTVGIMDRMVLLKLMHLDRSITMVGSAGDPSARIPAKGSDEFASLGGSINSMLEAIEAAQTRARQSEQLFTNMANAAPVLIRIQNAAGDATFFNEAWNRFTGRSIEEERGVLWVEGMHKDDIVRHVSIEQSMLDSKASVSFEYRLRRKDGKFRWMLEARAPLFDVDGVLSGSISSTVDITEQKELESQLFKTMDVAVHATRAKSDFLARMSHELRTPMNGVIGMMDIVLQSKPPKEIRHDLLVARNSAVSLLQIVNDILDYSKAESGMLVIERTRFDVRNVIEDAVAVVRVAAVGKGLSLKENIGDGVPDACMGDPTRVRQVIINLLGNAIKFTERGTVKLSVTAVETSGSRVKLNFSVADTGIGIPKSVLPVLFEAFVQADSTITRRFGGTGLGLAVSSQLVQLMGSRLQVESEPGQGSRFFFDLELELAPANEAPDASQKLTNDPATEWVTPPALLHILVVDDNAVNRLVAERMLRKVGHSVSLANSGEEAVAACEENDFDIILMDIQMPGMDGMEASRLIRASRDNGRTVPPIVALTAQAMEDDRECLLAAGMSGYITKPIVPSELFAAIAAAGGISEPSPSQSSHHIS